MNKLFLRSFVLSLTALLFCTNTAVSQTFNFEDGSAVTGTPAGWVNTGIGTYYRTNSSSTALTFTTLGAACNGRTKSNAIGSSTFYFKPDIAIIGFSVSGTGTGNTRQFSSIATSSTAGGTYTAISGASGTGTINSGTCGTVSVTSIGTISAGTWIRFIFTNGNVNVTTVTLIPSCTNPTIGTQPASPAAICSGSGSPTFTVAATGATLTYKWQEWTGSSWANITDGGIYSGSTTTTLTLTNPTSANNGYKYRCNVSSNGGCTVATDGNATLAINNPPSISSQSTGTASYGQGFGSPNPLTVTATGAGLTYQWYSSTDPAINTAGDDMALGTASSETPSTATIGTLYYYCVVSGTCPSPVTSSVSGAINIVAACTAPTFSVQPTNGQTECTGGTLTLGTVVADQSPTYQWYSNTSLSNLGGSSVGAPNGGSTDTYTPPSGTAGIFYYYCVATAGACPTKSNPVQITVDGVVITGQSTGAATYSLNASATALSVTVTGAGLSYQWYKSTDPANNTTGDDISVGTNSASYTPLTTTVGILYYYCVVSGTCPPAATSVVSGAITVVAYAVGDFGSLGTGNWGTTNANWRQWNGSAWATVPATIPSATDNVFILAGHTVTVEVSAKNCKSLTVEGTLKSSTLVNSPNYVRINGTPGIVTVNGSGFIGDAANPTGDNANGIGLDLFGTNITITGNGGSIYVSRMKTNTSNTTVTVDHDMTINYHGGTNQGGHTVGFYPNSATIDNTTLTINSGKTLTFAPWSVLGTTSSSNGIPAVNMTVNVNGTLLLQDAPAPNVQVVGAVNSFIYGGTAAGKTFTLNIGNGGIVNTPQICPNGTVSGGGVGTGTDAVITVTGTGQLNISKTADFRKASQIVTGTGAFNLLSGATLRIGSADGITASAANGHIQTNNRSYNAGANYSYEGTVAQTTGDGLTTANNLTVSNNTGVSLSGNVTVNGTLDLTNTILTTGANTATANAAVSRTTGWVNGNLKRAIASGASTVAFPIGDAGAYTPLSVNFGAGNSAGNVTASTTKPGIPPLAGNAPTGSGIDQAKYIDRSWTVSSTIGTPDYDATFSYVNPADVVGANTSALIIAKNSGGTWSNPGVASSVSPSVSSVNGQTSFGTFYLGEAAPVACTNNTFSGTGNWTNNARWSCGTPPASSDNVTIAAGANAILDVDFTVAGNLAMTATSTLTINPARTLTVSGVANFAGQSVTVKSDNTGTASIGQITGSLNNASNVTVERYIPNNGFRSWRLLSVPVTSLQTIRQAWQEGDANPLPKDNNLLNLGTQITGVFTTQAAAAAAGFDSTSVQAGMLRWNGTGWSNITSTNQPINNFNSYFLYIRGERGQTVTGSVNSSSATTLRTKGTVFTGDQTTLVGANAFALIPNLYPSAINFTGLTRTGGVNNLFYIWDSKKLSGSSLGTYQTFSSTNSFNCLVAGGSYTLGQPNTVIESGQSFFVTSGGAGMIILKESAKINGTNGSLGFRPSGIKRKIDTRLYNSSNEMLDANAVVFDAAYSKSVADEDAPKLSNPGANFAIETEGKLLAIAGTQLIKENDAIQFRMWNLAQGEYTIELASSNLSLADGINAMLEDSYLKTNTVINLIEATKVKFTIDANAGSSTANRFKLVFAKAKPVITNSKEGFTIAPNPVENGVMSLVFKNQPAGKYSVRILTTSGHLLSIKTINHAGGTSSQNIGLPVMMSKGTYTVEIIKPGKEKATQIVLVK